MAQFFQVHSENPQKRLIREAAGILRRGGIVVYPTDSGYALGCQMGNKDAIERIRIIRKLDENHHMTLMCRDLSELSTYAEIDNAIFRLLKAYTPGAYTFILKATKEVPRKLRHPKRKTIGLRVPDHSIAMSLLEAMDEPILSSTLILPENDGPLVEPDAIRDILGTRVNLVIDGGSCGIEPTTIVDLVDGAPRVIRVGKGDPKPFI